jgi:hypothetical protein
MNRRGRRAVGSSYRVHEGSIVVHGSARLTRHVLCQLRQRIDAVARPPGSEALGEANCYNHMALDSRRKPVEKEREREREKRRWAQPGRVTQPFPSGVLSGKGSREEGGVVLGVGSSQFLGQLLLLFEPTVHHHRYQDDLREDRQRPRPLPQPAREHLRGCVS